MPHKLNDLKRPVPSEMIEIAQSVAPLPIKQIATEVGLLPEELEFYGNYKAKVHLDVRERLRNVPAANTLWSPPSRRRRWARERPPRRWV